MQPTTLQPGGADSEKPQDLYRPTQASSYVPAEPYMPETERSAVESDAVSWEASEYIHRSKDVTWVVGFVLITIAFLVGAIWLQAWTLVALVVVMAFTMGFFAFRKPRVIHYSLTHQGLIIGERTYDFSEFRAFGVRPEDAFYSILIVPVKRFMPAITIYFAESDGEKIVDILGSHLPMEELKPDPVENLMQRLHF